MALWDDETGVVETPVAGAETKQPLPESKQAPVDDLEFLAGCFSDLMQSQKQDVASVAKVLQSRVFDVWDSLIEQGESGMMEAIKRQSEKFWIGLETLLELVSDPEYSGDELRRVAKEVLPHYDAKVRQG